MMREGWSRFALLIFSFTLSHASSLAISEIHYHPGAGSALERFDFAQDPSSPLAWCAGGPSPGLLNTVAGDAPGIQVLSASWTPKRPIAGQTAIVEIEIAHAAPIALATLFVTTGFSYRVSPGIDQHEAMLNDSGLDGDAVAGDGRWSARLPAYPASTLVRFQARFEDAVGGSAPWPGKGAASPQDGYRVGETPPEGALPSFDLYLEPNDLVSLERERGDRRFPALLVHDGRIFDAIEIRQRGAYARAWPKKSYKIFLNRDWKIDGRRRINLNSGWRDPAFLREHIAYRLFGMAGAAHSQSRIVKLDIHDQFYGAYLDVEQPDERYLRRFDLDGAALYKADSPQNQSDERAFASAQSYAILYELETDSDAPYADLDAAQRRGEGRAFLEAELDIVRFEAFLADPELRAGYEQRLAFFARDYDHAAFGDWIDDEIASAGEAIDLDRSQWNGDVTGRRWRAGIVEVEQYLANRRAYLLTALPPVPSPDPPDVGLGYLPAPSR